MKRLLMIVPIAALVVTGFAPAQAEEASGGSPSPVQVDGKAINAGPFDERCDADATPLGLVLTVGTTGTIDGEHDGDGGLNRDLFRFTVEPDTFKQLRVTGRSEGNTGAFGRNTDNKITTLEEQPDGTVECTELWKDNVGLGYETSPVLPPGDYWYMVGSNGWGTAYSAVAVTTPIDPTPVGECVEVLFAEECV